MVTRQSSLKTSFKQTEEKAYIWIKMYRAAMSQLKSWKERPGRKPLIVRGARQVGKTWLLKEFAKSCYRNAVYVNFEDAPQLQSLFIEDFDIERIVKVLEIYTGESIQEGGTLVILDELQTAERAITSLKYFQEKAPDIHVVAAGSLLGISMQKKASFPVGKVEFLDLNPLSFSEFLIAAGEQKLVDLLRGKDWISAAIFRNKLVDYLKTYFYVGGMPEVVSSYVHDRDWERVKIIQKNIILAYEADFSKHAPNQILPRIRMVWQSIPAQLAKENRKFFYGSLKSGARAKDFELAIQWLADAGFVYQTCRVTKPELPLAAFEELSVFKLFLGDVGLILQTAVRVIPIEVKAEVNVKSKSFKFFCEKYKPQLALRFSLKDFKEEPWMTNLPLYAVEYAF